MIQLFFACRAEIRGELNNWASSWEYVSSGVSYQARHKPVCAATEASCSLEILAIESRDILLSQQRTTKALIRLRGCAGWSAPLLFAYEIRYIFSWPGSFGSCTFLQSFYFKFCMSRLMPKPTKWHVRPAKTQISLGIRPVWSESLLSAWRKPGSLATHWAHSEDSDQTGWMRRLIWVFAWRTVIL